MLNLESTTHARRIKMNFQDKYKSIPLAAVLVANFLVYGINAFYYFFMPIYLKSFHTDTEIGILLSIGPVIALFAPTFWGKIADKSKSKNNVLITIILCSAVIFFAVSLNTMFKFSSNAITSFSFVWISICFSLLIFFMSPFGGILDVMTLEYCYLSETKYGSVRLLGTIGFGLVAFGIGIVNKGSVFYLYVILSLIAAFSIKLMQPIQGHARKAKKQSILPLFKDKNLILLLIFFSVGQFVFNYYSNFYPIYLTRDLGFPQWIWGLAIFFQVLGEIPFFLFFDKLYKKLGLQKIMLIGIALGIIRYIALGLFVSIPLILITNLLTGLLPTILLYTLILYLNDTVALEQKATSQTLIYSIGIYIPKILAGVLGGILSEAFGIKNILFVCAFISIIFTVLIILFPIKYKLKSQRE